MITYFPGWLPQELADFVWANLDSLGLSQSYWTNGQLKVPFPRLTAFYSTKGISYKYSGQTTVAQPFPQVVEKIAEALLASGHSFNSCLVNFYRDGKDSISWHRDDEDIFIPGSEIGSVSIGSTRRFIFRHVTTKEKKEFALNNCDLICFDKEHKEEWAHSVPKAGSVVGPRINFTFRTTR